MRYRGLTKEGDWIYGWYCKVSNRHLIIKKNARLVNPLGGLVIQIRQKYYIDGFIEVIPESVGMSIVLNDKNGKEIFGSIPIDGKMTKGGDIVIENPPFMAKDKNKKYVIRYSNHSFDLATKKGHWPKRNDGYAYYGCSWDNIEVIGNQTENPELLK